MRLGLAIVLLISVASADPRPATPAKPDRAFLASGRKLAAAGKHKEAIAAYEKYLAVAPDDEVFNAELGWSAFQLKDYVRAEAATRRAIKNGKDPGYRTDPQARPKGAALYNLGLILDAQGKRADAAQALVDSLAARPSKVVREKLQELDATRAAAVDALKPANLAGPFTSAHDKCDDCEASLKPGKAALAKPFEAVEVVQRWHALALAVQVGGKWYRVEVPGPPPCGGTAGQLQRATAVTRGTITQLEVDYTANGACESLSGGHENDWSVKSRNTIVIGVGPSGVPSATAPIPTSLTAVHKVDGAEYGSTKARGTIAWRADGSLDLAGTFENAVEDPSEPSTDDLLGHHLLAFP